MFRKPPQSKQVNVKAIIMLVLMVWLTSCAAATPSMTILDLQATAVMPQVAVDSLGPAQFASAERGAAIYQRKCEACHGETGLADGPRASEVRAQGGQVPKLVDSVRLQNAKPSDWFTVVTMGRIERLMPGFSQSLSAQERWDVLSYIWAMGTTPNDLAAGQALYRNQCSSCHGLDGSGQQTGTSVAITSLADLRSLASQSLADKAQLMRAGDAHQDVELTEAEETLVASYIQTLAYEYTDTQLLKDRAYTGIGELHISAINMTQGGGDARNLPVTLRVYDNAGEVFSRTVNLDNNAKAVVGNLPQQEAYFYQVDTVYQGARFYSTPQQFSSTLSISSTLPIFEVTGDASAISISEYHFYLQSVSENSISIVELYVFNNDSDKAYIDTASSEQFRSLAVQVPEEAMNLRFDGPGIGARFMRDGDMIYDLDAVPPGERSSVIVVIYEMPYRDSMQVTRRISYRLKQWDVLLPDADIRASDLTDRGLQNVSDAAIRVFSSSTPEIEAGGNITFLLEGRAVKPTTTGDDGQSIVLGLVTLAVAAGVGYWLISHPRREQAARKGAVDERQIMVVAIAQLDNQYEAGEVDESEYQIRRLKLKERLRDVWQ